MSDWSDEETDDPVYADRRNFFKIELWTPDGQPLQSSGLAAHQPNARSPGLC